MNVSTVICSIFVILLGLLSVSSQKAAGEIQKLTNATRPDIIAFENAPGRLVTFSLSNGSSAPITSLSYGLSHPGIDLLVNEKQVNLTAPMSPGESVTFTVDLADPPTPTASYVFRWRWTRGCSHAARIANVGNNFSASSGNKCTNTLELRGAGTDYANLGRHQEGMTPSDARIDEMRRIKFPLAQAALKEKKFSTAIDHYSEILVMDPKNIDAIHQRGHTYAVIGTFDLAIADFARAIALDRSKPHYLVDRARALVQQGKLELAILDLTRATELGPQDTDIVFFRSEVYCKMGKKDLAAADENKLVSLGRKIEKPCGGGGPKVESKDAEIERLTADIAARPNESFAYFQRGTAYIRQGKHEAAIADLSKAIELHPRYSTAYYNRALAYGRLKQYQLSVDDFTKVIELDKTKVEAVFSRGAYYFLLSRLDLALADVEKYIAVSPNVAKAYILRGSIYCAAGKKAEAVLDQNRVLALGGEVAAPCK